MKIKNVKSKDDQDFWDRHPWAVAIVVGGSVIVLVWAWIYKNEAHQTFLFGCIALVLNCLILVGNYFKEHWSTVVGFIGIIGIFASINHTIKQSLLECLRESTTKQTIKDLVKEAIEEVEREKINKRRE